MKQKLEPLLRRVEKPARYTGGELNQIDKAGQNLPLRMALAYPDVYEVGMSHLGIRILYHILNERGDTWCERVFAPWVDMERELRAAALPLTTLESATALSELDILGFTLQYEMSYTNILNMLDLGGIPIKSADRGAGDPFVLCGGPCAYNPEPLWEFVDLFAIGDGEEVIGEIADAYLRWKRSGAPRADFLRMAAGIPGIYVPALYTVAAHADGTLAAVTPAQHAPAVVHRRVLRDLDAACWPRKQIVPYLDIVHDRITLEIFRGCTRGCRFCQAGMVYRPVRERSVDTLVRHAAGAIASTGYDEISLSSLSTGDYTHLPELISALQAGPCSGQVSLSLPSLRLDAHAKAYMDSLEGGRKGGLTLAPEAGTQRLRDVINKGVTQDDLIQSLDDAFAAGWSRVKFYFMLGLPTETDEDIAGIAQLTRLALQRYQLLPKEKRRRPLSITVSTASFVPKADTPFQWCPQLEVPELLRRQQLLRGLLKAQGVKYSWHDARLSHIEAVFARGGRALSAVLLHAWRAGCRFDGWSDHFDYARWLAAFEKAGVDPAFYANRQYGADERLPWDHIHCGVDKAFLQAEYDRALHARTTPDCRQGCLACGLMAQCPLAGGEV